MNRIPTIACLIVTTVALGLTAPLAAQDNAKLLSAKGTVLMKTSADADPVEIKKGATIPTGATLITQGNTLILVGLAPGAAAIVEPNTTVTVGTNKTETSGGKPTQRTVALDMLSKSGGVISMLKRADGPINYQIRTPTGVAAARGTIYRVTGSAFQVVNGNVVVTVGGQQVDLGPLQQTDGDGLVIDVEGELEQYILGLIAQAGGSVKDPDNDGVFELDLGAGNGETQNPANGADNNTTEPMEDGYYECEYQYTD